LSTNAAAYDLNLNDCAVSVFALVIYCQVSALHGRICLP